jgi:hypothetical protein
MGNTFKVKGRLFHALEAVMYRQRVGDTATSLLAKLGWVEVRETTVYARLAPLEGLERVLSSVAVSAEISLNGKILDVRITNAGRTALAEYKSGRREWLNANGKHVLAEDLNSVDRLAESSDQEERAYEG